MPTLIRTAAIASILCALTTLGLIFLPDLFAPAPDFAGRMARVNDPAYQLRAWIYLLHPFLTFTAALGVFLLLRPRLLAIPGILGFGLWAATEAAQQCLTLFAFDRWRRAWMAGDQAVRATMELRAAIYDGLWDAAYMLLLIAFLIGNTAYGAAMMRMTGLGRIVGGFFMVAAVLTFTILVRELGGPDLPEPLASWVYPVTQPLARVLIGVWLWRVAAELPKASA